MKIFQNKKLFKKLMIVLLCILLLNFCAPNVAKAVNDYDSIGGKLLGALLSMFVGLGDGAISLLQKLVLQVDGSMIQVITTTSTLAKVAGIAVAVLVVVGGIVALCAAPAAVLTFATVLTVVENGVIAGVISFCVADVLNNAVMQEDFVLPQIKLSPYEIFANQVPLFDVDFFNPNDASETSYVNLETSTDLIASGKDFDTIASEQGLSTKYEDLAGTWDNGDDTVNVHNAKTTFEENGENYKVEESWILVGDIVSGITPTPTNINYNLYKINKIQVTTTSHSSTAYRLQPIIAKWYTILRDLAIVALLSILVYVGIRIMISSTASDKAKYKQWLLDWLVALCLLFLMHYIMSFSNVLVKNIISFVDATDVVENVDETEASGTPSADGVVRSKGPQVFTISDSEKVAKAKDVLVNNRDESDQNEFAGLFVMENGQEVLKWPTNNFTEQARMLLQYEDSDDSVKNYTYASIGYKVIYIVLVLYTFIFSFTYLKRVIYMAFLTLIAPLVALTYPIDKMNDGKAQAFSMWFKEYIFNLLIQPLHLILYMVLVGTAMDFAAKNLFYVVVALGFMTQGEKLLRKFFGFEKASTPGFLGGPAGAAIMMGGVNKLLGKPPRGDKPGKGNSKSSDGDSSDDDGKIRLGYKDDVNSSSMYGDNGVTAEKLENAKNAENETKIGANGSIGALASGNGINNNGTNSNTGISSVNNTNGASGSSGNSGISVSGNNSSNNSNKKKLKLSAGARNMFAKRGQKIMEKAKNKQPGRSLARGAAGLAGATMAMTAAGLVGITSGDPSKVAQYMTGAALGGYKFTSGLGDSFVDGIDNAKEDVDAFQEGADPEAHKEEQIQNNIKAAKRNAKLQNELAEKAGGIQQGKEAMDAVGAQCVRYGMADASDINTVYELTKKGYDVDDAIVNVKNVKKYGKDTNDLGRKDRTDFVHTIEDRVRKQNPDADDIGDRTDDIVKEFDMISKIYFKK